MVNITNKLRSIAALLVCALLSATFFYGPRGYASEPSVIEEVIVTGSRIARDPNLMGAQPVQGFDAVDLSEAAEFSLTDLLNDIPALAGSITQEQSITDSADGANLLNLRNLGVSRTLTLVNGRRHVGGLQGSSAVDIGSISQLMIEKVEVLTGGASAVYGADAVTGVVNILLKDDFEGFELDFKTALTGHGDGHQSTISALFGKNFAEGRGNVMIAVDVSDDKGLPMAARPDATYGTGGDWASPDFRFQHGDIGDATPNFAAYYDYEATGLIPVGLTIPTSDDFVANYNAAFPAAPISAASLTSQELALFSQAASAFPRAIYPESTFSITSAFGYVIPGNPFTFSGFDPDVAIDLNDNGVNDCTESFAGYNSVFSAAGYGVVGGCWAGRADGSYGVTEDGLVSGNFNGWGGSSMDVYLNNGGNFLLPDDKTAISLNGTFEFSESMTGFAEFKYVDQSTTDSGGSNSFWDLLFGAADNPYLPEFIQPVADAVGGVGITIDPTFFGSQTITERETTRIVAGVEGQFNNGLDYEASINYGKHTRDTESSNQVIVDRYFAAIDAITDPVTGQPTCRSSVDATAPAGNTPFGIPAYDEGYFSFVPGDGQCAPLNIWAGENGPSEAAKEFVLTNEYNTLELEQLVISASVSGDTESFFALPGGAVAFAAGVEYRDEESTAAFSPWARGILPAGSNFTPGTNISEYSTNGSLIFAPALASNNETGSYDVSEAFLEISLPILSGVSGAEELTVDLAGRFSDYSTIDTTTSWRATVIYAPINDLSIRATLSEAVRAPNITELFGPTTSATFRPDDPCAATYISGLEGDLAANVQANCITYFQGIGLDPFVDGVYAFEDPLSARFGGLTGGNPDLSEETAETLTYGITFTPSFLPGLAITIDYWDITIEDAISTVRQDDIALGCYQGAALNNAFCDLFTRNTDPDSNQFGGFNFMRTGQLNYAKFETDGYDLTASYDFSVGEHMFQAEVMATKVEDNILFANPTDLSEQDPELTEIKAPELAGNASLRYSKGPLVLRWRAQFVGEMLLGGVEQETYTTLYGPSVMMDDMWIHNLTGSFNVSDNTEVSFGIRNVTDEMPFITENAYPASPRGKTYWAGFNVQL